MTTIEDALEKYMVYRAQASEIKGELQHVGAVRGDADASFEEASDLYLLLGRIVDVRRIEARERKDKRAGIRYVASRQFSLVQNRACMNQYLGVFYELTGQDQKAIDRYRDAAFEFKSCDNSKHAAYLIKHIEEIRLRNLRGR